MLQYLEKPITDWIDSCPAGAQREVQITLSKGNPVINLIQQMLDESSECFQAAVELSRHELYRPAPGIEDFVAVAIESANWKINRKISLWKANNHGK